MYRPMTREIFDRKHLGEAIRRRRRKLRWTQKRLALEAGLNATTLSKYESGHSKAGKDNLKKISAALRCSPEQLLKEAWEVSEEESVSRMVPANPEEAAGALATNGFPQAELESLYDEYALERKKYFVRAWRVLFDALSRR
jgi:transcriptional regulator with XRE-family HTH domain